VEASNLFIAKGMALYRYDITITDIFIPSKFVDGLIKTMSTIGTYACSKDCRLFKIRPSETEVSRIIVDESPYFKSTFCTIT
jgi:hypothetical protein